MARPRAGRSGPEELRACARACAERSCADQGLPVKVTDRRVLAEVAGLLGLPAQIRQTGRKRESSKRL